MLILFVDMNEEHELTTQNTNSFKIFNQKPDFTTCLHLLTQMVSFTVFFLVISRIGKTTTTTT